MLLSRVPTQTEAGIEKMTQLVALQLIAFSSLLFICLLPDLSELDVGDLGDAFYL